MRPGYHTITLGCKLNRFDTAALEGELELRGLRHEPDVGRAAVVVVNTCTVTSRADADARKRIRSVRKLNPHCKLLVTGCYAERAPDTLRALGGVDRVFGNSSKPAAARVFDELGVGARRAPQREAPVGDRGCDGAPLPEALHFGDRARAFLKVQEGCRLVCSYCVIPAVRGPSRSVPPDRVLAAAGSLFASGYREIVLTGVNVGDYGRDLSPQLGLADLLRRLLAGCGPNRIRLNSLEPRTVTEEIVELMARDPRLAPHLQVPLQSGSDEILRSMRRNYRAEDYAERLARLRAAVPHAGLGADVIVGFPGETDERFRESYDFIARSALTYLHVFPWSPRPGTPAADLPGRVGPAAVRERAAALRALGGDLSFGFRRRFVGRLLESVVLGARSCDGRPRALTGNFIEADLDPAGPEPGRLVPIRITAATRDRTKATVEGGDCGPGEPASRTTPRPAVRLATGAGAGDR